MWSSHSHATVIILFAASGPSEQINGPNYLTNLVKNLAALAGTQRNQDMLKNANSAAIASHTGNYVAKGNSLHDSRPHIPVGTESTAGKKQLDYLLLLREG